MDIKDELDAMLNNLQSGSNSSKPVKKAAVPVKPEKTRAEKKVDSMSVDKHIFSDSQLTPTLSTYLFIITASIYA